EVGPTDRLREVLDHHLHRLEDAVPHDAALAELRLGGLEALEPQELERVAVVLDAGAGAAGHVLARALDALSRLVDRALERVLLRLPQDLAELVADRDRLG